MTGLLRNFANATARSGEVVEFADAGGTAFVWDVGSPGLFESLQGAVHSMRQYLAERSLDQGVKAAREGIEAVLDYLGGEAKFTSARDHFGLDAGYYIARNCTNYDFVALDTVEQLGVVRHVEQIRHYQHHPFAREAFLAACAAGLTFSKASDEAHRSAGFWVSRCGDAEVIAAYEKAGGTFTSTEREIAHAAQSIKVA